MSERNGCKPARKLRSVQVAGSGALAGALAAGLSAAGGVVPWLGLVPAWAVWLGGALICALTVFASVWDHRQ